MGFLSKIWKGVKKTAKKIGKGIKKVFGKVMKGIGKLGIVGQIGMMFLMPYAMSGLGSLFGTAGKLASWSTKLMGPNSGFLSKALGKTLEMVNVGGTWVKNAYTSVSTAISNGMDRVGNFFKTGEATLSADRTSVFSKDFSKSLDRLPTQANVEFRNQRTAEIDEFFKANPTKEFDLNLRNPDGSVNMNFGKQTGTTTFSASGGSTFTPTKMNFGDPGFLTNSVDGSFANYNKMIADGLAEKTTGEITEQSLLGSIKDKAVQGVKDINIFNPDSQIRKDIADFDIYKSARDSALSGAVSGIQQEAYYAISPDSKPKTPIYNNIRIPDIMDIGMSSSGRGVFNTVSLTDVQNFAAPRGNAWQANSMYNTPYINDILNGSEGPGWQNYMNNFAFTNSQTPTVPDMFPGGMR